MEEEKNSPMRTSKIATLSFIEQPKPSSSSDSLSKFGKISDETDDSMSKFNPSSIVENPKANFSDHEIQISVNDLKSQTYCDFHHIPRSEITRPEVDFLRKIMRKASDARDEKLEIAKGFKWYNNILGTSGRLLSTLSGSAGLGSLLSLNKDDPVFPILLTLSFITLGSALASTLQDHLNYESKSYDKKNTADAYNSIVTKVAQFLSTPGTDRKDIEIFTNSITLEMNIINTKEDL